MGRLKIDVTTCGFADILLPVAFGRHNAGFETKQPLAVVGVFVINFDVFYGFAVAHHCSVGPGSGPV
jgi:hypothetical protein